MTKLLKVVTSVVLSTVLTLGAILALQPSKPNVELMRQATREIVVKQPTGEEGKVKEVGFCSGVMVTNTIMLSAAHCDLSRQMDMYVNGKKAWVIGKDEEKDLLLLFVPAGCPCIPDVSSVVSADEPVYAVGYPLDAGQVVTEGKAQSTNDKGELLFTAPVIYGNSGGPVFVWRDGKPVLVAIVSHGTVIAIGGFIPYFVGHLNYGPGGNSILDFFFAAMGIKE